MLEPYATCQKVAKFKIIAVKKKQKKLKTMNSPRNSSPLTAAWRFWLPLCLQIVLILTVPAQAVYTHLSGQTVILQTVPVDPYDLLRGYSQTLRYQVSQPDTFKNLPGGEIIPSDNKPGRQQIDVYITLQAPANAESTPGSPTPWQPVAISGNLPNNLSPNQVALRGEYYYTSIEYGLETYYFPEDRREEINSEIGQTFGNSPEERPFVVEVKVDSRGNAVVDSLWVGDRKYKF